MGGGGIFNNQYKFHFNTIIIERKKSNFCQVENQCLRFEVNIYSTSDVTDTWRHLVASTWQHEVRVSVPLCLCSRCYHFNEFQKFLANFQEKIR